MSAPLPDEDAIPPHDPFEVELVAYLDGELDQAAARRVAARLAIDPQARARAAELKKTFDLLDYLPKPEPSATFATRTLDKLPTLNPAPALPRGAATVAQTQAKPKSSRVSQSVAALASARAAEPLSLSDEAPRPARRIAWAAGILMATIGFATAGYYGGAAFRSQGAATGTAVAKETSEELALSDRRLIENLPLYAPIDDIAFVTELAKPELFGDDPSVSFDQTLKVPAVQPEKPSAAAFAALEKSFKLLPLERQQTIRELDKQLYDEPANTRDRLLRVLEAYAAWLNQLPEADRRGVLAAATRELRLKQIQSIRDRQWVESLPPHQRNQLHLLGVNEPLQRQLIAEWKAEELERRKIWANVRKHPDTLDGSKASWPFDTESRRTEVLNFAKAAFRLDDAKAIRLTANELERYTTALNFAKEQGGATWHTYGKTLYDFVKKYEDYLLPPGDPKFRYADFAELPAQYQKYVQGRMKPRLVPLAGKWPEFPMEIHKDLTLYYKETPKKDIEFKSLPPLGPSKATEFTAPVRSFIEGELTSKLSETDLRNLRKEEGKWPDYAREVIRLCRQHELSLPGVMLPGSPKQWELLYGQTKGKS
jgi:hypothetical protein